MDRHHETEKQLVVIDQDSIMLQRIGRKLKDSPIAYYPFSNPGDLRNHLKLNTPQWMLVDHHTPPDDGFSFVEGLSLDTLTASTEIFIVSTKFLYGFNKQTEKSGNCKFLYKEWLLHDNNLLQMLSGPCAAGETSTKFEQLMKYAA